MDRYRSRLILSLLLCFTTLLLLSACGEKKEANKDGIIAIKPQIIFSQNGITITADSYKLEDGRLTIYGTGDNESDKDVESILGNVYVGDVGIYSYLNETGLSSGAKGVECELWVFLDRLSIFGVTKDMIGGELPLFLGASLRDSSEKTYDSCTIMLPAADAELPSLDSGGPRLFAYSGDKWDYTLSYIGERKGEDGGLELYISVVNNSDKPLTPVITFTAVNGHDLNKKYGLGVINLGPGSRGIGVLKLSAEECDAVGVDRFDDIKNLSYTATGIIDTYSGPSLMLEYRESDAYPTGEPVNTDRGTIRVDVTEVAETQVTLEVHVDITALADTGLVSDIENMTFVNGCGQKFTLTEIHANLFADDLCYSGTMDVRNIDDNLSLCFLVIGDDVWLLG